MTTFCVPFEDGSVFTLPPEWEDVFVAHFGRDPGPYAPLSVPPKRQLCVKGALAWSGARIRVSLLWAIARYPSSRPGRRVDGGRSPRLQWDSERCVAPLVSLEAEIRMVPGRDAGTFPPADGACERWPASPGHR